MCMNKFSGRKSFINLEDEENIKWFRSIMVFMNSQYYNKFISWYRSDQFFLRKALLLVEIMYICCPNEGSCSLFLLRLAFTWLWILSTPTLFLLAFILHDFILYFWIFTGEHIFGLAETILWLVFIELVGIEVGEFISLFFCLWYSYLSEITPLFLSWILFF